MSNESATVATQTWPVLSSFERRVLGVLVEKAKTTPDAYPLSVNALVTGCNQKSNRDPVLNLTDDAVEHTLESLIKPGLVSRVTGSRVERWRHHLYEVWNVNKVELAILAELLLRGAQTEGELRGRASRMEPLEDVDALRLALKPLVERGLVVYLGPEGKRGTTLTHGFHHPKELEQVRANVRPEPAASDGEAAPRSGGQDRLATELAEVRTEVASLRERMAQMQEQLTALSAQVRTLQESRPAG